MKGTIFEKGNKLVNKIHRVAAWYRVKKYWLFMSPKDYKKNLFFNIVGMIACLAMWIGAFYSLGYIVAYKAEDIWNWIKGVFRKEKES